MEKYLANWGSKYFTKGKTEKKNLDWFNEHNGYYVDNIKAIKKSE